MLLLLAVAACTEKPQVVEPAVAEHGRSVEGPSPQLSAIDSLLWHQPDSALACLLPYFDTCGDAEFCVSTATAYNRHYAHLLLSELLYKNDYAQVNRAELLQAVAFFASLMQVPEPAVAKHGRSVEGPSNRIAFLDARTHYINGVGYYENDSVVEACAEYLKTLEIMESHFEEKDLVGHKARFMAYTYNRLGDMFSEHFMMESSIACYEKALFYCRIEPTSLQGVSNILYRIGQQYDMKGEINKARDYYGKALEEMPNCNNLSYRNLVSIKAFSDYKYGMGIEHSLMMLRQIITQTIDESESLIRFALVGDIFFEEGMFDSAMYYLEPVFYYTEDELSRIQAAEYLHIIYDSIGDSKKSDECMRFLAQQKKTEGQNKALVSRLEDQYQSIMNQQQQKQAKEEREKAIKKVMSIIIPIAVAVAMAILIMSKLRSKRLLREQQVEADKRFGESERQHEEKLKQRQAEVEKMLEDKEKYHQQEMEAKEAEARKELEERDKRYSEAIEVERQTNRMKQAAISGRLKRSNQEVRELKDQIKQLDDLAAKSVIAASFDEEPVCRLIMERVKDGQFKSKIDYIIYKDSALDKQQLLDLRLAADRHFGQFTVRLKKAYPELTNSDLDYCCLYLLGLTDADIAALMQKAYSTVSDRSRKLKAFFDKDEPLSTSICSFANETIQN